MEIVAGLPRAEYNRRYLNDRYAAQKQLMFDYLGGVCIVCGTNDDLEIDHRDWCKKTKEAGRLWPLKRYGEMFAELDKCQLLCSEHHLQKSKSDWVEQNALKDFTHGTVYGWMKRKCDCGECQRAKRAWNRIRNAKRRDATRASGGGPRGEYRRPAKCGEVLMYRRGCRCTDCKGAAAKYERLRLAAKAATA
ncbi:hypothetical protein Agsp01_11850 [Agromyces sp. NBRC 114283]|nr:hypothetical protein Agsp01_11850 [Agromyces sp. NBRC 114283]